MRGAEHGQKLTRLLLDLRPQLLVLLGVVLVQLPHVLAPVVQLVLQGQHQAVQQGPN